AARVGTAVSACASLAGVRVPRVPRARAGRRKPSRSRGLVRRHGSWTATRHTHPGRENTMHTTTNLFRRTALAIATVPALVAAAPVARAQAPDFDTVAWTPLDCGAGDPAGDETPSAVDLVGDAAHLSAYTAHDASYVYFRLRVNGDPNGSGGFA